MKKTYIIIAIIVISFFAAWIIKDQLVKSTVTVVASSVTGAPVHIDGFSLGIIKQSVRISGLKIYNPAGFPKGVLLDLEKVRVDYDLGALLKKRLHLIRAEIKLKEMSLVKNKDGKLNVDSLKVAQQGKNTGKKQEAQMPMQIDFLKLGIGRIIMKDYSLGAQPVVKVYNVNLDKEYKNITSAQQLAALIISEPMKAAGIQGAAIYAVAMLGGVAILPVAVAAQFVGKDSAKDVFNISTDKAYAAGLAVLKQMGKVVKESREKGLIEGDVDNSNVDIKITKISANKTEISASSRKYLLPRPEIAAGIVYQIGEELKSR